MLDKEKLKYIINTYKADFARIDEEERYKWEAIGHFKKVWDIDAPDFVSMLKNAFKEASNLLTSGHYYAYSNLLEFAEYDSAEMQRLFEILYDESKDLKERYETFRKPLIEYFKKKGKNHSQDLHAISVYLAFKYPEKYFIYKYSIMKGMYERIEHIDEKIIDSLSDIEKYKKYCELCKDILTEINDDTEIQDMSRSRLDDKCYRDEKYHLLATDIAYFGSNMKEDEKFSWIPFYTDFADKLLTFKNDRKALIELIKKVYSEIPMKLPKLDNGEIIDIDPFTVYGLFNKGLTDNNRIKIIDAFKKELGINKKIPTDFNGIPVLNNMHATFYYFAGDRKEKDIDNLWELFEFAINYSKSNSSGGRERFIELFNTVREQQGVAWNITMGLFWMRPYDYINLDSCSRAAFNECRMIPPIDYTVQPMLKEVVNGEDYLKIIDLCKECFKIHKDLSFPELSHRAWANKNSSDGWWPSLEEYNPNLSKEDWKKYILEVEKPEHPCPMQMLKAMMELGGVASCKQLSQKFGGTTSYYVGCTTNLGRRVKKYFNLPACMDGEQERYFPFPFQGKAVDNEEGHQYLYKVRPELLEALNEIDLSDISPYYDEGGETMGKTDINKNTILYGPPGTGKTYITARYAVAIIENKTLEENSDIPYDEIIKKYNEYKSQGRIEFTTFHQSYGYEEFIEGIKPVISDNDDIQYKVESGLFKSFCEKVGGNRSFNEAWDSLLESVRESDNRYIFTRRTGTKISVELRDEESFVVKWNGATQTQNVLGKARINKQWEDDDYTVRDSLSGGSRWLFDANQAVIDEMISRFELKCKSKDNENTSANYVFIIDEINRGNISKIFGELITLIEPSKRVGQKEAIKVKLPYSQKLFGVPDNVYIIGTMNTADRSIAAIDTALRRRFAFRDMMPDSDVIKRIEVDGVSVSKLLDIMNKRIEVLYDREHTIGHAYFTRLLDNPDSEILFDIFRNKIFPLLQEYFYEDYEKIRLVFGDNQKSDPGLQFISEKAVDFGKLFGSNSFDYDDKKTYRINEDAFNDINSYAEMLNGVS